MAPELLSEQIKINRKPGINSEIYFYNEALKNKAIMKVFKKLYNEKPAFPELELIFLKKIFLARSFLKFLITF